MKYSLNENSVSWFIWLPSIWLVCNSSRILFWTSSPGSDHSGNVKGQIVYSLLMLLSIYCLSNRKFNWRPLITNNAFLIIFITYCVLSITWSDYPTIAIKRIVKTLGTILQALVICTEFQYKIAFNLVFKRSYTFLVLSSFILIIFFPSEGIINGYWVGITSQKNLLGEIACIGAIIFLLDVRKKGLNKQTRFSVFMLLISLFLLVNCKSTTSIVVFAVATSFLFLLQLKVNTRFLTIFSLYVYILGTLLFFYLNSIIPEGLIASIFSALGKDMTFTGRNELWEDVLTLCEPNFWLGVGYDSFWISGSKHIQYLHEKYIWIPNQGHSGYIDMYANLGIIGISLFCFLVVSQFIYLSRRIITDYYLSMLRMILLLSILWFNFSESTLCVSTTSLWFIFLVTIVNYNPLHSEMINYSSSHSTNT